MKSPLIGQPVVPGQSSKILICYLLMLTNINRSFQKPGDEVLIGEIPLQGGQEMTFEYDFGDQWVFDILVEKIDPEMKLSKAKCIESYGDAPNQYGSEEEDW